MQGPSAAILDQTCDYFAAVVGQDASGVPQFTYPTLTIKAIPCSAQPGEVVEVDEGPPEGPARLTRVREWKLFLGRPLDPRPRDKFAHTDRAGVARTLFAHISRDEAGRGSTTVVRCVEKV